MPSPALIAQAAGGSPGWLPMLGLYALIGAIFYVLLILPQKKRTKAHEKLIGELGPGDRVVTSGGLVGTVTKVEEGQIRLKLGPQIEVSVLKSHIAGKSGEVSS
ncbi:MAG: preprotein translocase subunit YajC [Acidobacteriota bacterium]|nr:preprotein translocase subunit YajC [Acidobacteriota bacterium]